MPAEADDRWTVGRLLTWTKDFLQKKGSDSPRLDAEVLLAAVMKCQRVNLYTQYEDEVSDAHRSKFRDLVKRRADGAPVAYLVGKKEFYSLRLHVSPAVLIPRGDSEIVVVEALARLKGLRAPRAVDVGTGSGCLALACVHQHKTVRFVAIDVSPEALAVAQGNAEKLNLDARIEFRAGDLLDPVAEDEPFDLILSNPPYIASAVIPTLEPTVAKYEPHLALDGGPRWAPGGDPADRAGGPAPEAGGAPDPGDRLGPGGGGPGPGRSAARARDQPDDPRLGESPPGHPCFEDGRDRLMRSDRPMVWMGLIVAWLAPGLRRPAAAGRRAGGAVGTPPRSWRWPTPPTAGRW